MKTLKNNKYKKKKIVIIIQKKKSNLMKNKQFLNQLTKMTIVIQNNSLTKSFNSIINFIY